MFLSGNKKNSVYPCKPKFYIKVGVQGGGGGSTLYRHVFVMSFIPLKYHRLDLFLTIEKSCFDSLK